MKTQKETYEGKGQKVKGKDLRGNGKKKRKWDERLKERREGE